MKTVPKLLKKLILFSSLICIFSCNNEDNSFPDDSTLTIAQFTTTAPKLTTLVEALRHAKLNETLNGIGPYTLFAPTNDAFKAYLSANGFASVNDIPSNVLKNLLLNHTVAGKNLASSLSTGYINSQAKDLNNNPLSLYIDASTGIKINNASKTIIKGTDFEVSNGVVHVIDAIIALPTVADFIKVDPNFDTLEAALTREANLTFMATLATPAGTEPAPFTAFAPTNGAFTNLFVEQSFSSLADIPLEMLEATLNHHIVAGTNLRSNQFLNNMIITTMGGDVTANVNGEITLTDANGRVSKITITNVQAMNGVIHVVNKVILPPLE